MALLSWARLENIPATSVVEPAAMPAFEQTARDCIDSLAEFQAIEQAEKPLQSEQFLKIDPSEVEPWRGTMERNSPGLAPAGAPVFIAQGTADPTVRPDITKRFGEALAPKGCVWLRRASGRDAHFRRARQCGRRCQLDDRSLRGAPAPSDCER